MKQEHFKDAMNAITNHIEYSITQANFKKVEDAVSKIIETRESGGKIFIVGSGRSGLVGKAFAVRLSQFPERAYFNVFFAADVARKVEDNDLIITVSGSGRSASAVHSAKKAKEIGAGVLAITSKQESELMNWVDMPIILSGGARDDNTSPLAPLGTLFECTAMIFIDCIIAEIMKELNVSEDELQHYQLDDL